MKILTKIMKMIAIKNNKRNSYNLISFNHFLTILKFYKSLNLIFFIEIIVN